ncbi:MAG: DUF4337 family protein [Candidatus Hydrogenedentes bacterium]|nr:DUF4337 family protein [Candidatus Hydrogenedentota bacterium]
MSEETNPREFGEQIESVEPTHEGWTKYLALTTAIIAVIAAIASLASGTYADRALLEKNQAVLVQAQASDRWNYYQAKGIKKDLADGLFQQSQNAKFKDDADRYGKEQEKIKDEAQDLAQKVEVANTRAEGLFERHHRIAMGVTFFQIAIALSAIAAMLRNKLFWGLSVTVTGVGVVFFVTGVM